MYRQIASSHSNISDAINISNKKAMWTTVFVILVFLGYIAYRSYYGTGTEHYVGNVGNGGIYNLQREPEKKQLGCYNDMDCPDETRCTAEGICIPIIHDLPRSKHTLKWGRGREKEKPT